MSSSPAKYALVPLANGSCTIRSLADNETFHPVAGPIAEAEALYVHQLQLLARVPAWHSPAAKSQREKNQPSLSEAEFIIWDVGLGAGANALTAIRRLSLTEAAIRIVSFDRTLDALHFAQEHAQALEFPAGFENEIRAVLERHRTTFRRRQLQVTWDVLLGEFPEMVAANASRRNIPPPHVIFFDAFSPARNPEMWTLPLFENLYRSLDPQRACSWATFSRSTMVRAAMLLAGFFVGLGESVAGKEETTIAANTLELIAKPLDRRWLERVRLSQSAEPLNDSVYRQAALTPHSWERLQRHPQFV